jgi:hypothetical protein
MNKVMKLLIAILFVTGCCKFTYAQPASQSGGSQALDGELPLGTCTTTCLTGYMKQYMDALWKHDSSGLPLGPSIRVTENTRSIALGDGLWKTAKGLRFDGETIADAHTRQVCYFGAMDEQSQVTLVMIRLKIAQDKITEIETLAFRPSEATSVFASRPDLSLLIVAKPYFEDTIPNSQRLSRNALHDVVTTYYEGLAHQPGNVAFAPLCNRVEDGQLTTSKPKPGMGLPELDCAGQFSAKAFFYVQKVRDLRIIAIDPAYGLVVAESIFDQRGGPTGAAGSANRETSTVAAEVFKIRDAKIELIQAVTLRDMPYGTRSGWEQ